MNVGWMGVLGGGFLSDLHLYTISGFKTMFTLPKVTAQAKEAISSSNCWLKLPARFPKTSAEAGDITDWRCKEQMGKFNL